MKYNALFEYVIRISGENTDDIEDFDDRDNFRASVPENLLFERVLLEANNFLYFALFDKDTLSRKSNIFNSLLEVCKIYISEQQYRKYAVLRCDNLGQLETTDRKKLDSICVDYLTTKGINEIIERGETILGVLKKEGTLLLRKEEKDTTF